MTCNSDYLQAERRERERQKKNDLKMDAKALLRHAEKFLASIDQDNDVKALRKKIKKALAK